MEITIVLVIIALLLGGILKAQEMVTQAKIKNVVADFPAITVAYNGYQDRYHAIPGDDAQAGSRWVGATSGNGDGVVSGTYNSTIVTDESRLWWDDLRRSGLLTGTGTQQPFNIFTGNLGVQTGNAAGSTSLGAFGGLIVCTAGLPDKIAIAVDTQLDDGHLATGTVRGQKHTGGQNPDINAAADASDYAETGTNVYTLCRAL
jgi:hypothetical protein